VLVISPYLFPGRSQSCRDVNHMEKHHIALYCIALHCITFHSIRFDSNCGQAFEMIPMIIWMNNIHRSIFEGTYFVGHLKWITKQSQIRWHWNFCAIRKAFPPGQIAVALGNHHWSR
jgi:hypothetical protein